MFRRVVERRNNATDSFDQKLNVVVDVAVFPVCLRQKATDVGSTETPPRPRRRAASSFLGPERTDDDPERHGERYSLGRSPRGAAPR